MFTVEEMKVIIEKYGLSYGEISEKSGVPISTVQKIFGGLVKKPRSTTLKSLSEYFIKVEWDEFKTSYESGRYKDIDKNKDDWDIVAETSTYNAIYNKGSSALDLSDGLTTGEIYTQSGYTYNDYAKLQLPRGVRVEVFDGKLVKMDAPTTRHQVIAGELFSVCRYFIRKNKGSCLPIMSPVDVRLEYKEDGSDMTVFEPDFLIVCDKKKIEGLKTVNGAPDFVVEVISPSTRKYDMYDKMNKYRISGVREYWTVDYDRNSIVKHFFEGDGDIKMYTMDDVVPVEIYGGKLKIDFKEMKEYIESMS